MERLLGSQVVPAYRRAVPLSIHRLFGLQCCWAQYHSGHLKRVSQHIQLIRLLADRLLTTELVVVGLLG